MARGRLAGIAVPPPVTLDGGAKRSIPRATRFAVTVTAFAGPAALFLQGCSSGASVGTVAKPTTTSEAPESPTPAPTSGSGAGEGSASPSPTSSPTEAPTSSPTIASDEWLQGTWTTGYWDCCRPSCSWPNKGSVDSPTKLCVDGNKVVDDGLQGNPYGSICDGGQGSSCSDNMPFVVKPRLSMGFAAAAVGGVSGLNGDSNCGQCFELLFVDKKHPNGNWGGSHPDLAGKSMIVQVTNIGYDVSGEHSFDLQIPGAGQGIFTTGCPAQFSGFSSGDFDCDNNYGGCNSISGCDRLPPVLQPGCEWRYTWYKWLVAGGQTNNPYVDFRRVRCPTELVQISGSTPTDDDLYPEVNLAAYE